jgi:hypothetical protein
MQSRVHPRSGSISRRDSQPRLLAPIGRKGVEAPKEWSVKEAKALDAMITETRNRMSQAQQRRLERAIACMRNVPVLGAFNVWYSNMLVLQGERGGGPLQREANKPEPGAAKAAAGAAAVEVDALPAQPSEPKQLARAVEHSVQPQPEPEPELQLEPRVQLVALGTSADLRTAAHFGDLERVGALIAAGVDVDAIDHHQPHSARTAIMQAAKATHVTIVQALIDAGAQCSSTQYDPARVNYRADMLRTARDEMAALQARQDHWEADLADATTALAEAEVDRSKFAEEKKKLMADKVQRIRMKGRVVFLEKELHKFDNTVGGILVKANARLIKAKGAIEQVLPTRSIRIRHRVTIICAGPSILSDED